MEKTERNRQIFKEYVEDEGSTITSIAAKHGLTKQRVHMIIQQEMKKEENLDEVDKFFTKWVKKD